MGLVGSEVVVGYYTAAEKILSAILGLRFPVDVSLFPYMVKNKDMKFFKKFIAVAIGINTLVCTFVMFIFARLTLTIVFGPQMLPAIGLLRIFWVVSVVEFVSYTVGYLILVVYNHSKEANLSIFITSICHLIILGILLLTHNVNMYSVAILASWSCIFTCLLRGYNVLKYKLLSSN